MQRTLARWFQEVQADVQDTSTISVIVVHPATADAEQFGGSIQAKRTRTVREMLQQNFASWAGITLSCFAVRAGGRIYSMDAVLAHIQAEVGNPPPLVPDFGHKGLEMPRQSQQGFSFLAGGDCRARVRDPGSSHWWSLLRYPILFQTWGPKRGSKKSTQDKGKAQSDSTVRHGRWLLHMCLKKRPKRRNHKRPQSLCRVGTRSGATHDCFSLLFTASVAFICWNSNPEC